MEKCSETVKMHTADSISTHTVRQESNVKSTEMKTGQCFSF